jgi:hypothetical protein
MISHLIYNIQAATNSNFSIRWLLTLKTQTTIKNVLYQIIEG